MTSSEQQRVHFVSLGCPKNLVDSEVMLGHLAQDGYVVTHSPEEADVIVVNTCGFIDAAKEESVNTILEMSEYKKDGRCSKLVVTGCLSQRYAPELAKEIPEVDHFLGTGNFEKIAQVLKPNLLLPILDVEERDHPRLHGRNALKPFKHFPDPDSERPIFVPPPEFTLTAKSPRVSTQPHYTSYVKISEGCSNTCAFCIIPKLRGPQRSRRIEDIVHEVEQRIAKGTVELNLIAQDLCAYGKDQEPKQNLATLLRTLDALPSPHPLWIRCLYAYPRGLTEEVMDIMANAKHIVPYLDMPLQHIAEPILQNMRRGKGGNATRDLLLKLKERVPGLVLRTTFITGLPGETDADFQELYDLVKEMRFERMGVFTYSREENTPAGQMDFQVPKEVAQERCDQLMALQKEISREQQEALVGSTLEVLVEGVSDETELLLKGRHKGQAPDIDGITYINSGNAQVGDVVKVLIDQAMDYDLVGGICT